MTKRVLISLLLLLCALCLSVTSFALLQNKIALLGQALENAVYTDAAPEESCAAVEKQAENCLRWLRVLSPHKDVQPLSDEISALSDLQKNADEYRAACRSCLRLLRGIENEQRLRIENIL